MNGLSIVICTKNRPADLKKLAVHSVLEAQKELQNTDLEVIIIDDGNLDAAYLSQMKDTFSKQGIAFGYINKSERPGLFLSRIEGVLKATFDILLFIDDDTAIERDYLTKLMETYHNNPDAAGIGGVDLLEKKKSMWRKLYETVIGKRSLNPGRLSLSTYPGIKDQWPAQEKIFKTEFLLGGNMSFRKNALAELTPNPCFKGYSLGEDLYLSLLASTHGKLLVNPDLKIRHYYSPVASDSDSSSYGKRSVEYHYAFIMNHYELLKAFHFPFYRKLSLLYTALGLIIPGYVAQVIAIILRKERPYINQLRGYQKGVRDLLKNLPKDFFDIVK